jgi:hypothetical protein
MKRLLMLVALLSVPVLCVAGEVRCPLKPDPPPTMDGNFAKWYKNPCPIVVVGDQVTYNKAKWKGEDDLSGTLYLYWDANYLYLAAEVVDSTFIQDQSGDKIWYGDHIEFFLDTKYDPSAKGHFGAGQFHIGFSPGNLTKSGDPLFDLPPEVVIAYPPAMSPEGIRVAAVRTEKGYNLEAQIPWKLLKVEPKQGMTLGLDFSISDTDSPGSQDKMTSLVAGPWNVDQRDHLVPMKLCDSQGK